MKTQTSPSTDRCNQASRPTTIWLRLILVSLLAVGLLASSQGSPRLASQNYAIPWSAFTYGGGKTGSSNYAMVSAIGPAEAPSAQSQNYHLGSGFIPGIQILIRNAYRIWLPLIWR